MVGPYVGLTTRELEVIGHLTAAYSAFCLLPPCHPADLPEFVQNFHVLQRMVMARAAVRAHPDTFTHVESFE